MVPADRPRPSRGVYLRRRIAVFGTVAVVLAGGAYLPLTLLAPLPTVAAETAQVQLDRPPAAELDWPGYGAGAIGAVGFPGALASHGADDPLQLASISKVVTALVVLDAHPLSPGESGPSVTMTARDVSYRTEALRLYGQVSPVQAGWTFSEQELLELALVHSANNYARSLAVWAFGSDQGFLDAAAAWLAKSGFATIRMSDPTGLSPENVGSPSELVELGRLALANPVVAEITSMQAVSVPNVGLIRNTNELLGVDGVVGIKTGTLDYANLLFAADLPVGSRTVRLVGVVLGAPDHDVLDRDIQTLVAEAREGFHEVTLATAGEEFASYTTPWGARVSAVAARDATAVVWSEDVPDPVVVANAAAVGMDGDQVGTVAWSLPSETLTIPLVLSGPLDDPGPWWRLGHPGLVVGAL